MTLIETLPRPLPADLGVCRADVFAVAWADLPADPIPGSTSFSRGQHARKRPCRIPARRRSSRARDTDIHRAHSHFADGRFCSHAWLARPLRWRGMIFRNLVRHIRNCRSWRNPIGIWFVFPSAVWQGWRHRLIKTTDRALNNPGFSGGLWGSHLPSPLERVHCGPHGLHHLQQKVGG